MHKKILITGAAGMVGTAFAAYLKHNPEWDVYLIARNALQQKDNSAQFSIIDILDTEALNNYIKKLQPNYIINLAAQSSVGVSWQKPQETITNNVQLFTNLLDAVRLYSPLSKILHVGSAEVYGIKKANVAYVESDTIAPTNAYGLSRVLQEKIAAYYFAQYNISIICTRSFNHLSKLQIDKFFVPSIINQMVSAKKQGLNPAKIAVGNINVFRDFLHVQDVLDAYILLMQNGTCGEIYNVGSGNAYSLKELIETIAKIAELKIEITVDATKVRAMDNTFLVCNNAKLKETINWEPKYSIEATLREMYNYKLNK
jgi:GDP-4-dehydro-6-deoxy-D-mannose reductase